MRGAEASITIAEQWKLFCSDALPAKLQEKWHKWFTLARMGQASWPMVNGLWKNDWNIDDAIAGKI